MEKFKEILHRIVAALEVSEAHKAELHQAVEDATTVVHDAETVEKAVEETPKSDA